MSEAPSQAADAISHTDMANAIRALSIDAVEAAKSGHPGMPMGMADVATVLFSKFLRFDPTAPDWPDRDRFILSAGHGSMLLYSLLYLTGYPEMTLEELKKFRQLGARTAGHPEYGHAPGIETTTGPLGQGIANAVGFALAERMLNARFGDQLVDHYTYVIASDGDLMEGISHEAISLAGHLKLNRLIVLFDDNGVTIDGPASLSETGDQLKRFEAAGWEVTRVDGHSPVQIEAAIRGAVSLSSDKPSMIACRTRIGYGSPAKEGKAASHGAPLGADEVAATRERLGWPYGPFEIPDAILDAWRDAGARGQEERLAWEARRSEAEPENLEGFQDALSGDLPAQFTHDMAAYKKTLIEEAPSLATRAASQKALDVVNASIPNTISGSADLTGSNNTRSKDQMAITPGNFHGRFIHYGIREHGMAAAMNGMALHGGFIPYSGTFLVFSDYCRPSIRLAALMEQRVIHVMTHDSIGLGEDGPTHQPVEHLAALRAIPNTLVLRPADALETAECWEIALGHKTGPSVLALTRQKCPAVRLEEAGENLSAKGAYELRAAQGTAQVSLFATGSEVGIAIAAKELLEAEGIGTRVVSIPSFELFDAQEEAYRLSVMGEAPVRIGIEAAIAMGWNRLLGDKGAFIGMSSFGASAPYLDLYQHFGITPEKVVETAKARLT